MHSSLIRRVLPATALAAVLLAAAAACGDDGSDASGSAGSGDKTAVIGSFYPMAWLSEKVGGDRVSVTNLTKPGAEPHDLELTPKQIVEVGQAGYVVYVREVQPAVDDAVSKNAKDKSLDAASVVKTLAPPAEDEHAHEGEGEAGHEEEETTYDPHIWLDPSRMATIATTLGDRLAKVDPADASTYKTNAQAAAQQLNALDQEFRTGLQTCKRKSIVTSHAAFGYLADRYGLEQIAIAGVDPNNEPSPKRLAELTNEIKEHGATTVFTETLVSPKVAQTLASEAGVKTATLDPLEGLAEGATGDYLSVMRQNLQTLRTALDCT